MRLKDALEKTLAGWRDDVNPSWLRALDGVELGFDSVDELLTLEPWEPIFPARKGRAFPGAPPGAHVFRAFDAPAPEEVRCVVLGQDPYPCPAFATGRAFEAGNVARWRELDKMFSTSVRAFVQLIVAARTGEARYAADVDRWPSTLSDIECGRVPFEKPAVIADRWAASGVLLLNSALTLSRFDRAVGPHQARGHLPLWRPLMLAVLRHLAGRGKPLVCIGFGAVAESILREAGLDEESSGASPRVILRAHPAEAERVFALENPFTLLQSATRGNARPRQSTGSSVDRWKRDVNPNSIRVCGERNRIRAIRLTGRSPLAGQAVPRSKRGVPAAAPGPLR